MLQKIKLVFNFDFSWIYLKKIDVLFVLYDINCYYFYENRPYSPLLESLKENYESKDLKCAIVYGPFTKIKSDYKRNKFSFNGSFSRAHLLSKIAGFFLKEEIEFTRFIKDVWHEIFKRTNPKRIICIYPSNALCLSARLLNIDIAELQHGVVNDNHPAYGFSFKEGVNVNTLPTSYICYDQVAYNSLSKWCVNLNIKIELIENPWTKRFIEKRFDDLLVLNSIELNKWIYNLPFSKTVLVTLGWGWEDMENNWAKELYKSDFNMPQFNSLSLPLVEIIKSNYFESNWLIRLHPVQMLNQNKGHIYAFLKDHFNNCHNVLWDEPSNAPLALLLQKIDLHLTLDSTITSEAVYFNVKTGLICPDPTPVDYLKGYFVDELKTENAKFVLNNIENLTLFISSNLCRL